METVSENTPKRGRPRVTSEFFEDMVSKKMFPEVQTRRGLLNHYYFQEAFNALHDEPDVYTWLIDHQKQTVKQTILMELGRLVDPDDIRSTAKVLCAMEPKPTSRQAVQWIRNFRLGRFDGNIDDFGRALYSLVNDYLSRFPQMDKAKIVTELKACALAVEEALAK